MNNSDREHYDDEIDLLEIIEIIWQGKWIIVAAVVIAVAAAYAYVANKKVVYKYTLPYSAITAPDTAAFEYFLTQSVIFSPVEKNSLLVGKKSSFSLDIKKKNLSLITANSSYEGEIIKEARLIGGKLSELILNTAINELRVVNEEISAQLLNSEILAQRFFNAKSVIYKVESGENLISFKPVVKTVESPKTPLVLALSVVMGGVAGLFFIFLLRIAASYKNRQQITAQI